MCLQILHAYCFPFIVNLVLEMLGLGSFALFILVCGLPFFFSTLGSYWEIIMEFIKSFPPNKHNFIPISSLP